MKNLPIDLYSALPCFSSQSKRVLVLTANKVEDIEFFYPYYRFIEEGMDLDVATPTGGAFKGKRGLGLQETLKIADINVEKYDILYIPGGRAASKLRRDKEALALVRDFAERKKLIVSICHGPQVLAAANVVDGYKMTSWPEVQIDLEEAGAIYMDDKVILDAPFLTARWPADLPPLIAHTMKFIKDPENNIVRLAA